MGFSFTVIRGNTKSNVIRTAAMFIAENQRIAAYARVSTDSEEQMISYEAQVDYYTKFIKGRSDWEFMIV